MSTTVQQIDLSAGGNEFTYPVTVTASPRADGSSTNISTDPVTVSLGTDSGPGANWVTPQIITHPTVAQVVVSVLVGTGPLVPTAGTYWLWVSIGDTPETVIRRTDLKLIIV